MPCLGWVDAMLGVGRCHAWGGSMPCLGWVDAMLGLGRCHAWGWSMPCLGWVDAMLGWLDRPTSPFVSRARKAGGGEGGSADNVGDGTAASGGAGRNTSQRACSGAKFGQCLGMWHGCRRGVERAGAHAATNAHARHSSAQRRNWHDGALGVATTQNASARQRRRRASRDWTRLP